MTRTFSIKTLGCKLNQYESASIAQRFLAEGWKAVEFGQRADIVIINTCTVTDRSEKKCRNAIRQGARVSPSGKVIVTGCMVESSRETISQMPEVMACFPNSQKDQILNYVHGSLPTLASARIAHSIPFPMPFNRTRGYVKIQDGCNQYCSYCIVPKVRGNARSRPIQEILSHVRVLVENLCSEIVLTGITIGNYFDSGATLAQLVKAITEIDGNFRIRITSIEPTHVTDELIEILQHPKICRHLHLPLQSGSNRILKLMNRPYTQLEYLKTVEKIKSKIPLIALGTDVIVGFPSETENDFNDTLQTIRSSSFAYVHQFTFSPRATTPASLLQQLPYDTVRARSERLRHLATEMGLRYRKQFIGITLQCIIEKKKNSETFIALSDNYIKISIPPTSCARAHVGKIVPVLLKHATEHTTSGTICAN
ncbi:MAG: tRNA (N(6)-L-threonylcarbamoyladenosine(37)-C(2))-methylthiotransferase MtaB [Spirochaetes bacterium]|nr:tRNA (N(6)-L-threonylcarbamoyladenosine(37)-C(2))-methylthiotransferase MtaB [Spirochaetota bacterium]